jgi:hypothetical protein
VRPQAAGHDGVGGSGPYQAAALQCALNHSGSPDPRLDRFNITRVVFSCPNWMTMCFFVFVGGAYTNAGVAR